MCFLIRIVLKIGILFYSVADRQKNTQKHYNTYYWFAMYERDFQSTKHFSFALICQIFYTIPIISGINIPFVIRGEYNAHSPLWESPVTNHRGQVIEDIITGNSLCIVNNGENT